MEETLSTLVGLVIDLSPELWRIGMQQVTVGIARTTLGLILSITLLIAAVLLIKKGWNHEDIDIGTAFTISSMFCGAVGTIFTMCGAYQLIGLLLNPEWYAIKYLLLLLPQ